MKPKLFIALKYAKEICTNYFRFILKENIFNYKNIQSFRARLTESQWYCWDVGVFLYFMLLIIKYALAGLPVRLPFLLVIDAIAILKIINNR